MLGESAITIVNATVAPAVRCFLNKSGENITAQPKSVINARAPKVVE